MNSGAWLVWSTAAMIVLAVYGTILAFRQDRKYLAKEKERVENLRKRYK